MVAPEAITSQTLPFEQPATASSHKQAGRFSSFSSSSTASASAPLFKLSQLSANAPSAAFFPWSELVPFPLRRACVARHNKTNSIAFTIHHTRTINTTLPRRNQPLTRRINVSAKRYISAQHLGVCDRLVQPPFAAAKSALTSIRVSALFPSAKSVCGGVRCARNTVSPAEKWQPCRGIGDLVTAGYGISTSSTVMHAPRFACTYRRQTRPSLVMRHAKASNTPQTR